MDTDILATVVAGLVLAVAVVGTVYPVLPGSPLAIGTLMGWGWILGSTASWTAAAIAALLAAAGWAAAAVLTGRTLKRQRVPGRSIAVAMAAGVVGLFVIPFFGLFIGFAAGLLLSELARRRDLRAALDSSLDVAQGDGARHPRRVRHGLPRRLGLDHRRGDPLRDAVSRSGRESEGRHAAPGIRKATRPATLTPRRG